MATADDLKATINHYCTLDKEVDRAMAHALAEHEAGEWFISTRWGKRIALWTYYLFNR